MGEQPPTLVASNLRCLGEAEEQDWLFRCSFLSWPALSNGRPAGQGWTEERRFPLSCHRNVTASSVHGGAVRRSPRLSVTSGAAWDQHSAVLPLSHSSLSPSLFYQSFAFRWACSGCVRALISELIRCTSQYVDAPASACIQRAGKGEYVLMHVSVFRGSNPSSSTNTEEEGFFY